jgi:prolyl-tRNA synthetase
MRLSEFLLGTLKEVPQDAELISHQLMYRAGMIRKLGAGLYTWLPMGLRVLRKVEKVVREEMNKIGAMEVLMPAVQPAELWEETGRWEKFGGQLLKIKDRAERDYCFGPTHEEVVTDLMRRELKSYKQLPMSVYQIQTKFRDEIRPRFGVMRAREFLMKDAYSFHIDKPSLENTYEKFYQAYSAIFTRLGLKFRAVLADTGAIGGSGSHEFHVLADSGEDAIAYCEQSDYAANVELATRLEPEFSPTASTLPKTLAPTPGITSVTEQAKYMGLNTNQILKTLLVKGRTEKHPVVGLLLRGDHELNEIKAQKHPLVASPFELISIEAVLETAECPPGFVGPIELASKIPLIGDPDVFAMRDFSCGANQADQHYINVNWERDLPLPEKFDLRKVVAGDLSPDGKGSLNLCRGIEVGHIFQLGDNYSEAMGLKVLDEQGKSVVLQMGCYGIGVSRIVAASIEQNNDAKGIIWPTALAPFQVILLPMNYQKSHRIREAIEQLYQKLLNLGIDVVLDDRKERPGVMFNDAELIGIPHRLVLGERSLDAGKIEYQHRTDAASQELDLDTIGEFLLGLSGDRKIT